MSRRSLREIPDTVLPWRLSSLQLRVRLVQARDLGPAGVQLGLEIALCVFEGSNLGKGGLEIDLKLVGLGRGVGLHTPLLRFLPLLQVAASSLQGLAADSQGVMQGGELALGLLLEGLMLQLQRLHFCVLARLKVRQSLRETLILLCG